MEYYEKYESELIQKYRKGAIKLEDALCFAWGYLCALVDFGDLPESRISVEYTMTEKRLKWRSLDADSKICNNGR